MNSPQLSVLLPVYNCENYIKDCIDSVLNQTFSDFELLIIDDKSTDSTVKIIQQFKDDRIKLTVKEKNSGYTNSLNWGIDQAKGKYIARMDGDDICMLNRFERQFNFLESNPDVILCGTSIQLIGATVEHRQPPTHEEIIVKLCFETCFFHPTIMGPKQTFVENKYDSSFEPAEDYELWTRLASKGKLANISEILLEYRVHLNQISKTKSNIQSDNAFQCKLRMLSNLNVLDSFTKEQIKITLDEYSNYTNADCKNSLRFFDFLVKRNKEVQFFDQELLIEKVTAKRISFLKRYFEKGKGNRFVKMLFLFKTISLSDFIKVTGISRKIQRRISSK
ncbi:glycosyltransferase [Flavobacterium sp. AS60]|uniref:glycosyltransferase family 2 protein n=1 Tax=Flavobacterium anseongense TaxID=2910677 RepID=UPI001F36F8D9|nr:glycosyltransferase [Flavobacterium sp. AS60]MCF6129916.1 glycosyltransferase [Flavobacterium sp. AS60]